jgi:hypothetical protein
MATTNIIGVFKVMLIVQLMFAVSIVMITRTMPDDAIAESYVDSFAGVADQINVEQVGEEVSSSLQEQTNIPLIELGALVFYSGNILIDLLLNFAFAIPEMIGLLIYGITQVFNLPTDLVVPIQGFASATILVLYFLAVVQILTGIRSGRIV